MRSLLALLFLSLSCVASGAEPVSIVRTWTGFRTVESFTRISEYFNGQENTGGQVMLRSQPQERSGFYFLCRVRNTQSPIAKAKLNLRVITPHSPTATTYTYEVSLPKGDQVFQVGLTGSDWKDPAENPVAWQIELLDPAGQKLATDESFLWSKPDRS
jgi:hypothetical protein